MNILEIRQELKLSRKEMAEKLGVSPRTLERWEQELHVSNKSALILAESFLKK